MQCARCRCETPPPATFCGQCGAALSVTCGGCGAENRADRRYCAHCGAPLAGPPDAETYLASRLAQEGERKQVTVLFADLQGSMELLADRDPEEARRYLDAVVERMMEAVHRYEGTVNQVMGDGIMALFGAPVAQEDHAVRACFAALRMQESVDRYAEEVRAACGVPLRIRVGLNSGEVVVRSITNDLQMDYTAVGQTTHLAARMEQMAQPGRTLITAPTFQLAEGRIAVRPLGPLPIKGLDAPVEVYELLGRGAARSRLHVALARGLTRFVGRDAEVARLQQALDRAAAGHGQVLAVAGEAGVGKSRLLYEFVHSPRTDGWLVLEAACVSYGRAAAYLPAVDLLKAYFGLHGGADPPAVRDKVRVGLRVLGREAEALLSPLLALLDVPAADEEWERLDPMQRRERTLRAARELLLAVARAQPLLLVVDDLHWIDAETQALLDDLVANLSGARLLLLVGHRPEYRHGWRGRPDYSEMSVDSLSAASAGELLRALLGDAPALQPLEERLIARTEGNPFFLEESVRALVETGVLAGEPGRYTVAADPSALPLGATAQAVLAARIDRLPAPEKRLLQCAAVLGTDVPAALLVAIADAPEEAVHRGLATLQSAGFLDETRRFPDPRYSFKHALTHEVAYRGILQRRRRALHARIVEALETAFPDRRDEHVERLAHHAFRGEVWEKAVAYARQAGARALRRSVHREAGAWFEQALQAHAHLPATRDRLGQAFDLRIDLRNALLPIGEVDAVLEHLRAAEAVAVALHDRNRRGWAWCYMSACHWVRGSYRPALEAAARTRAAAVDLGDTALRIYASLALGWTCHSLGDYRRGVEVGREIVEFIRDDMVWQHFGIPSLPAVIARTWLASNLAELGEFEPALAGAGEAVRFAETVDEPWSLVSAYLGLGVVHLRRGDLAQATEVLGRGLGTCERYGIRVWRPPLASSLGYAHAMAGDVDIAIPLLERASAQAAATGLFFYYSSSVLWLAEAHLLAGRPDEADRLAGQALALCREHEEAGNRAYALRLLGAIAAHTGSAATAATALREALARAAALGMQPLAAHCHLDLGRLAGRAGRWTDAHEQVRAAVARYEALGMRGWAARARALLAEAALRA